ncbi:hypothetical protein WA026_016448 [Henosepilachna vigintioctopunctata]
MWMHEAKNLCPEIEFARVAELRGRADLTKYREAGNEVALVLSSFVNVIERASVDEAYLDLTDSVKAELAKGISNVPLEKLNTTHVVGCSTSDFISNITLNQDTDGFCEDDLLLAVGGVIVERIREAVLERTGYKCSAGIAHNKILAKLVCGLHKPNKQTILPQNAIVQYFSDLPLKKIKRLGGKFGKHIAEELKILYVGELLNYSEKELINKFDVKTGRWLYNIARGIDHDPVSPKLISKSISCCKRFPGKNALFKHADVEHWTNELCLEISERLQKDQEENNRKAKMLTISFTQEINKTDTSTSKTIPLKTYDAKKIAHDAFGIIRNSCLKPNNSCHVKYLGISAGNFDGNIKKLKNIEYYLGKNKKLCSEKETFSNIRTDILNEDRKCNEISSEVQLDLKNKTSDTKKTKLSESQETLEFDTPQKLNILNLNKASLNCHESKSHIDADVLPNSNIYNIEKVAPAAEVQTAISDGSEHNLSDSKDFVPKFDVKNETFLKDSSELSTAIDEDDSIGNSFFARYFEKVDSSATDNSTYLAEESDEIESKITSSCDEIVKCEECGQSIQRNEIISHRDFHFALNLHKVELISCNPSSSSHSIAEYETLDESRKKRKTIQSPSTILDAFLEKPELDSTIVTEICSKCNKKIKLTEWEFHSDYHIAKELHKELNSTNNSLNSKISKNMKSGGDISQYLKRKSS